MNILYVAQNNISQTSGMGRVAWHWRAELERRGHRFVELGRTPLGRETHPALYPWSARMAANRIAPPPDLILVHEPSAACFAASGWPTVVFSHGLERQGWTALLKYRELSREQISLRSRLFYPLWRLVPCDYGIRHAAGALVLNREDFEYCLRHYDRSADSTFLFKNGINPCAWQTRSGRGLVPTILFLGSWLPRKGTRTLIDAAEMLHDRGLTVRWLLAGTGVRSDEVLSSWSTRMHSSVEVVSEFSLSEEPDLMRRADIFVLPSFFEGQPLSLLQAMAAGLPVIASDTCGQRDLVVHEESGLLFQPGDVRAFVAQLERCIQSEALRLRLGEMARNSVTNRTWEAASAEVADFVERIFRHSQTSARAQ